MVYLVIVLFTVSTVSGPAIPSTSHVSGTASSLTFHPALKFFSTSGAAAGNLPSGASTLTVSSSSTALRVKKSNTYLSQCTLY